MPCREVLFRKAKSLKRKYQIPKDTPELSKIVDNKPKKIRYKNKPFDKPKIYKRRKRKRKKIKV